MRIEFTPSPDLFPFESRWFDSAVGRVHYIDEGRGRPILFLHGNPTWSFLYRGVVKQLSKRFRCIAVDYPGFGLSDRPEGYGYTPAEHAAVVESLITHLCLDDLIVMGQDWGGPIGIKCALSVPDRVSGFVFGNTWFWPTDKTSVKLFSRFMSTRLMQWAILERNYFVNRLIPAATASALPDEVMEHYRSVQPNRAARVGVAELPRQLIRAEPWLKTLAAAVPDTLSGKPLLLVWGMRDVAFPPGYFIPRWQSVFRSSTVHPLPHAKHFFQEDAPESVAEAITKWSARG